MEGNSREEKRRVAETEALFREVNERIAETAERFDVEEAAFYCECADPGCLERLEAPLDRYEHVREDGSTFLLAPGHDRPELERVVAGDRGFQVVEKVEPMVARLVRTLDPRAETG